MRPDRIVVGEVRGAEAFELTRAVNAGCGFACTVHANSARDALDALVNAALMAGEQVTESIVRKVFASRLDLVVHLERQTGPEGRIERRVGVPPHPARGRLMLGCGVTPPVLDHRVVGNRRSSRLAGCYGWTGSAPEFVESEDSARQN